MAKMEDVVITCVGCPLGCQVQLTVDASGEISNVNGNKCKEGKGYAIEEYKNPVRVLTATVRTESSEHPLLAVRTSKPIPKTKLIDGMGELAGIRVKPPVKFHQVIISNVGNTGVDIIASTELVN